MVGLIFLRNGRAVAATASLIVVGYDGYTTHDILGMIRDDQNSWIGNLYQPDPTSIKGRQRVLNIAHVKMMPWMGLEHRFTCCHMVPIHIPIVLLCCNPWWNGTTLWISVLIFVFHVLQKGWDPLCAQLSKQSSWRRGCGCFSGGPALVGFDPIAVLKQNYGQVLEVIAGFEYSMISQWW